ncbi:hypothetical protein H6G80_11435 [Nostoc sp. FACHB-87]|uniref:hypothetical protein n=1 Tax=Nostocales TaxID=1161 RepID=UPI001681F61C|nr:MULTISPECIES: hypothetical protein [Nostocales]MBD2302033.1 hypothetical protein [Nostoc sp. FACHB-190]MBD2454693.1 hypothetical protein [Nostoc sp. FACHB-87]MBD2475888.1 hypothetical protein [Anabaena sp. FACHB-83]MBD2490781.1 hypothetical protein [Aulosira sp. FACHB-615]
MRIWTAIVVLTSSWLVSGLVASQPINAKVAIAADKTASSRSISQASNTKKPIAIDKAEFGIARVDARGKVNFIPTFRVPLQEGSKYGWRIQLKDYQGEVTWREVLRLPKPPETWATDDGENFSVSADGTESVMRRKTIANDGVIQNYWTIAAGDPPGKHKIQVYIDDRLIATFDFEVFPMDRKESSGRNRSL